VISTWSSWDGWGLGVARSQRGEEIAEVVGVAEDVGAFGNRDNQWCLGGVV